MPPAITHDVLAAIGNTPLIRLTRASEATGCEILGKAEFLNPGQSIKDRAALRASLDRLLAWDFDRLVLSHGRNVDAGAKELLRDAYAFL